jgi:hypothetical protein
MKSGHSGKGRKEGLTPKTNKKGGCGGLLGHEPGQFYVLWSCGAPRGPTSGCVSAVAIHDPMTLALNLRTHLS